MKQKDLKKLPKKALIKRLKGVQRENRTLLTQIKQIDEEIATLTAQSLIVDEIFSQTVRQNLEKMAVLEAKLARYQAKFGQLDLDEE